MHASALHASACGRAIGTRNAPPTRVGRTRPHYHSPLALPTHTSAPPPCLPPLPYPRHVLLATDGGSWITNQTRRFPDFIWQCPQPSTCTHRRSARAHSHLHPSLPHLVPTLSPALSVTSLSHTSSPPSLTHPCPDPDPHPCPDPHPHPRHHQEPRTLDAVLSSQRSAAAAASSPMLHTALLEQATSTFTP